MNNTLRIHFTDYFDVSPDQLAGYGAFNISLHSDLPLFIDPFLLFNSSRIEYKALHDGIIKYVKFLRDKSAMGALDKGHLQAWFTFSEIEQTWLGFSRSGNKGRGLGMDFARALNQNLHTIFESFGNEDVTQGSHIEKLCLIKAGVGRDNISDLATNLIKEYLLEYTQTFAHQYLPSSQRKTFKLSKVRFNYATETWESGTYELPSLNNAYVILCPRDLLTKDHTWINRHDLLEDFHLITDSVTDDQLRAQINNYLLKRLSDLPTKKERHKAIERIYHKFPVLIEYFIRHKEQHGREAQALSDQKVSFSDFLYVTQVHDFSHLLHRATEFYSVGGSTYEEAHRRLVFLKQVIEDMGGWRFFCVDNKPIRREQDLQLLFRLTWFASPSSVTREANDGRGPVDFKISRGAHDQTLIEFKLASNTKLRRNLQHQVEIYVAASQADHAIKAIIYFTDQERENVYGILRDLGLNDSRDIVLIDARPDNKISASKATSH